MDTSNIISSARIEGYRITRYLGVIYSGPFASYQGLLDDVVNQGNLLGADWVVSFFPQSTTSKSRANRPFTGFGTAVMASPQ
jgi:uncharacterized protein YbjQ (UPF0145 family)